MLNEKLNELQTIIATIEHELKKNTTENKSFETSNNQLTNLIDLIDKESEKIQDN